MSDDERFERDLRDAILRGVPPAAPGELRSSVRRVAGSTPVPADRGAWRRPGPRAIVGIAAAVIVALVGGLALLERPAAGPAANSSPFGSSSPAATASAPAATPSATASQVLGPEVDEFGLIDAQHGWVFSHGLLLTADGGQTWTFGHALGAAQITFLDADHGWLVPFRSPEDGPFEVDRTVDGGLTWQKATMPEAWGIPTGLTFFDATHGLLAFEGDGVKPGSLWSSSDGGATWTKVGALPVAIVGSVSFSDGGKDGWALAAGDPNPPAGHPTTNELYVTHDGGATWLRSALPKPPAGWTAGTWQPVLAAPSVFGSGGAVLPAWYGNGVSGQTQLLVTRDGGANWTVATTLPSTWPVPVDALDAENWIAAVPLETDGGGTEILRATDDGGADWRSIGDVTPTGGAYVQLSFSDRQHGWVLDNDSNAPLQLYATDDGGASWRLLSPSGGPTPTPVVCSADNVVLGQEPAPASGPATTWFNVFASNFDPNSRLTLTFDHPVIAWPGEGAPTGPIETFTLSASDAGKLSFRPADPGVTRIVVRMDNGTCSATTTVELSAAPS